MALKSQLPCDATSKGLQPPKLLEPCTSETAELSLASGLSPISITSGNLASPPEQQPITVRGFSNGQPAESMPIVRPAATSSAIRDEGDAVHGRPSSGQHTSKEAHLQRMEQEFVHDVYNAIAPHFSSTRFAIWPKVFITHPLCNHKKWCMHLFNLCDALFHQRSLLQCAVTCTMFVGSAPHDCGVYVPDSMASDSAMQGAPVAAESHAVELQCPHLMSSHPVALQVRQFIDKLAPGSLVADVGCGNGKYFLVRQDIAVLGSDRSSGLAQVAATRLAAGTGAASGTPCCITSHTHVIGTARLEPHTARQAKCSVRRKGILTHLWCSSSALLKKTS